MSPGVARVVPGASVAQRYVVQRYLGRGELGEVYEARDGRSGAAVRLKLFFPEFSRDQAALSALSRAAESAGSLASGVMAKHFDAGFDPPHLSAYTAGELVSGPSLEASGSLSIEALGRLLQAVAPALDQAHAAALIHRALKPTNVFISSDTGAVKITDFGIALLRAAAPPPPGWAATPGWLGPDAAEPRSPSTPAMDVYALGLLSFFVLTGKNPFRSLRDGVPDLDKLWLEMLEPLGSARARAAELGSILDARLDPWFEKALAPHPRARFASVGEMSQAFGSALAPAQRPESGRLPAVLAASGSEPEGGRSPAVLASAQPLVFMRDLPPPAATTVAGPPAASPPVDRAPAAPVSASNSGADGTDARDDHPPYPAGLPKRPLLIIVVLSLLALATLGALAAVSARFLFEDDGEEVPSSEPTPSFTPSGGPAPPAPAPVPPGPAEAEASAGAGASASASASAEAGAGASAGPPVAADSIQPPPAPKPAPRVVRPQPKRAAPPAKPAAAPPKKCGTFINPCK